MSKSSNSQIYRFKPESMPDSVYSPTTFENKKNKKQLTFYLTFVWSTLFMITFMSCFSIIYISNNDVGYYEDVESNTILQPGIHLHFIWSEKKLKFASTKDSFLIPTAFGGGREAATLIDFFNITVDYTVINVKSFVKSLQKNDKKCMFEIITFVQHEIMKNPCMHTVFHNQVYEITPLVNTTIDECGILITNATFPKNIYNSTDCQPRSSHLLNGNGRPIAVV